MIELIGKNNIPTNKKPGFHYVICLIEVWKPSGIFDFEAKENTNVMRLTECKSISCTDAYSSILGTMNLVLPKGAVLRKTIANASESVKAYDSISISKSDDGVVRVLKNNVSAATVADFSPGNRIRVYAGYTTDKKIADLGRIDLPSSNTIFGSNNKKLLEKYKNAMDSLPLFDGFIVKCSDNTPITIQAESLASSLKKVSARQCNIKSMSLPSILDYLKFEKLTNIDIHSATKGLIDDINLPATFKDGMNMLDVFTSYLKNYGLYSKIQWDANVGKYALRIGYSFTSGVVSNSDGDPCIYDGKKAKVVYSDYHVANDSLAFENIDQYFLVLKCRAILKTGGGSRKRYSFCVRLNVGGANGGNSEDQFKIFNEKAITKDEKQDNKEYGKVDVDTSSYKVIDMTYPTPVLEGNKDIIKKWAKIQFRDCMRNGVSGTLTLFGDLHLTGGDIVAFIDGRHKTRCGIYLVEKVNTSLSSEGLRQEITIPYRLVGDNKTITDLYDEYETNKSK